ncbi:ROK family transcriptional regulator [Actinomycetospora atypica]|uniref:ROK family transcriptional regulator n=1 Tax=Actinomycetospora atypica TaxID=1290095 RepID=A0ABV9YUG2_9PSEU
MWVDDDDETCEPRRGEVGRAAVDRWRTSARVLAEVRRAPGVTRVELATRLGLSSATATETVARLRSAGWLAEEKAPVSGRGRPTTCLRPDPAGPVVLGLDLRHEDWRLAVAGLDGVPTMLCSGRRSATLSEEVAAAVAGSGVRPVALGVAVPAPISDDAVERATELDWASVRLDGLVAPSVPVLRANDATLAGLAEARSGAAAGVGTALSLIVEVGIGGTLLLDGRPVTGAHGAAGEFGHLPFGDPSRLCPCGAWGCWAPEVDGRALARRLGLEVPDDPRTFALDVLARAAAGDGPAARAVAGVGAALGRGVAGLVNAHDPEVVVLGGLAPRLRGEAFDAAYRRGLMAYRRSSPTPVRDAAFSDDAALRGALALALDHATSAEGLARATA